MTDLMTTLPLVPAPGTAGNPLLTPGDYLSMTGDSTSEDDSVQQAITDAVDMLCNELQRTLLYGQYTENQYLYANGMVYPSATPIDLTHAISSGEQIYDPATDEAPGSIVQGDGVWVGWFTPLPWMPVFTGVIPPQTNITYYGGFQPYGSTAGPTRGCPPKLARMIAKVAYYLLNPAVLQGLPGGIKSVSIGGVSMSGDLYSFMIQDPQLKRDIRSWKHPHVHPWQT